MTYNEPEVLVVLNCIVAGFFWGSAIHSFFRNNFQKASAAVLIAASFWFAGSMLIDLDNVIESDDDARYQFGVIE